MSGKIIKLNPFNKEEIKAVSELHKRLLPESVVSKWGNTFMRKFYYKTLVAEGLMDVYLYKTGEQYVGFISCTTQPFTFMADGKRKNLFHLLFIIGVSVLLNPLRARLLFQSSEDPSLDTLQKEYKERTGQFMSFGVLEDFRKQTDANSGKTIPSQLMNQVFDYFKEKGKQYFFLLVLKENKPAIAFYKKFNGNTLPYGPEKSDIVMFSLQNNN